MATMKQALPSVPYLHIWEIQTHTSADPATREPTGFFRYRWRCSCKAAGPWHEGSREGGTHAAASRRARSGGERHVAAMER